MVPQPLINGSCFSAVPTMGIWGWKINSTGHSTQFSFLMSNKKHLITFGKTHNKQTSIKTPRGELWKKNYCLILIAQFPLFSFKLFRRISLCFLSENVENVPVEIRKWKMYTKKHFIAWTAFVGGHSMMMKRQFVISCRGHLINNCESLFGKVNVLEILPTSCRTVT